VYAKFISTLATNRGSEKLLNLRYSYFIVRGCHVGLRRELGFVICSVFMVGDVIARAKSLCCRLLYIEIYHKHSATRIQLINNKTPRKHGTNNKIPKFLFLLKKYFNLFLSYVPTVHLPICKCYKTSSLLFLIPESSMMRLDVPCITFIPMIFKVYFSADTVSMSNLNKVQANGMSILETE